MFRQHFYELGILLIGVFCSHLVAGVTEDEEGNQDESREQHGHYREALLVRHIVTGLFHPFFDFPFRTVPHLII